MTRFVRALRVVAAIAEAPRRRSRSPRADPDREWHKTQKGKEKSKYGIKGKGKEGKRGGRAWSKGLKAATPDRRQISFAWWSGEPCDGKCGWCTRCKCDGVHKRADCSKMVSLSGGAQQAGGGSDGSDGSEAIGATRPPGLQGAKGHNLAEHKACWIFPGDRASLKAEEAMIVEKSLAGVVIPDDHRDFVRGRGVRLGLSAEKENRVALASTRSSWP